MSPEPGRRLRATTLAAVGALALGLAAPVAATSPASAEEVANIAHRGASVKAPENTMAAITQAAADHADFVGIDVHLTADGVPVVVHDRSLARTTNVEQVFPGRSPWWVDDLTLAEIERLDAGSWKSSTYTGERIRTLADVLDELAPSPVGVFLELKQPDVHGGVEGIGRAVVRVITEEWTPTVEPGSRRLVLQSFDKPFLRDLHREYPVTRYGLLGRAETADLDAYPFADNVQVRHDTVTRAYVEDAHARPVPVRVGAWTVNDASRMNALADLGIDAISTDRPDRLRALLQRRQALFRSDRWPASTDERPTWSVRTPRSALVGSRFRVSARLATANGSPARWQWAAVQSRVDGTWRTLQKRATDGAGSFATTVAARRGGLRLRVVSLAGGDFPVARSSSRDVAVRRHGTLLRLSGDGTARAGARTALQVRWHADNGRAVTGRAVLRRWSGGRWVRIREVRVADGRRQVVVRPRRTTRYQMVGLGGSWYVADRDGHRVVVR